MAIIAVAAGVGAASASCDPTGWVVADVVLSFAFGAVVVLAAWRARRWTSLVLVGIASLGAHSAGLLVVAAVAIALAVAALFVARRRAPIASAAAAALAVQVLLRCPEAWFQGLSAVLTAVAVIPTLVSGYRYSRSRARRITRGVAVAVAAGAALASIGVLVAAAAARAPMTSGADRARTGFDAARAGRQDEAVASLREAEESFREARGRLTAPWAWPARAVPVVGQQVVAAEAIAVSGAELSQAAGRAAQVARYDDLRSRGGQVNLDLLTSMQAPVDDAVRALDGAQGRLDEASDGWLLPPVAGPLAELRTEVGRARADAGLAAHALAVAPGLLGADSTKRYLILFANPAESRNLGGFVAAYGELTAAGGKVSLSRSGRISELSDAPGYEARQISGQDEFLARYRRLHPERFLQNVTASPDFPTDAAIARELYQQAAGPAVDGVIYVDPFGLAALLKLTGPVTVDGAGQQLRADNAAELLVRQQYISLPTVDDRTDLMANASRATFDALTSRELPGPRVLGDALGPAVRAGHLAAVTFDERGRALLERLEATAAFPTGDDGDFLSVRGSNANPNKIDSFLSRDITYEAEVDAARGHVDATASIVFHNEAPDAGLPKYIIGHERTAAKDPPPEGTNVMYVSVYSRLDLRKATWNGEEVPVSMLPELGQHTYALELAIPSKAQGTLVLALAGAVPSLQGRGAYALTIAPQPMVNPDHVAVRVRAKQGAPALGGAPWSTAPNGQSATEYEATEPRRFTVDGHG